MSSSTHPATDAVDITVVPGHQIPTPTPFPVTSRPTTPSSIIDLKEIELHDVDLHLSKSEFDTIKNKDTKGTGGAGPGQIVSSLLSSMPRQLVTNHPLLNGAKYAPPLASKHQETDTDNVDEKAQLYLDQEAIATVTMFYQSVLTWLSEEKSVKSMKKKPLTVQEIKSFEEKNISRDLLLKLSSAGITTTAAPMTEAMKKDVVAYATLSLIYRLPFIARTKNKDAGNFMREISAAIKAYELVMRQVVADEKFAIPTDAFLRKLHFDRIHEYVNECIRKMLRLQRWEEKNIKLFLTIDASHPQYPTLQKYRQKFGTVTNEHKHLTLNAHEKCRKHMIELIEHWSDLCERVGSYPETEKFNVNLIKHHATQKNSIDHFMKQMLRFNLQEEKSKEQFQSNLDSLVILMKTHIRHLTPSATVDPSPFERKFTAYLAGLIKIVAGFVKSSVAALTKTENSDMLLNTALNISAGDLTTWVETRFKMVLDLPAEELATWINSGRSIPTLPAPRLPTSPIDAGGFFKPKPAQEGASAGTDTMARSAAAPTH